MTTTLTDAELAMLEELAAKATPGEWEQVFPYSVGVGAPDAPDCRFVASTLGHGEDETAEMRANAAFIAAACNAAPSLVDEVRRLRGVKQRAEMFRGEWNKCREGLAKVCDSLDNSERDLKKNEMENAALRERVEALEWLREVEAYSPVMHHPCMLNAEWLEFSSDGFVPSGTDNERIYLCAKNEHSSICEAAREAIK